MTLLLLLALQDAAVYEDPAKEIQWARSFDAAFEEAKLRSVPVWIFMTSDN
jgi:hypothetical protein